MDTIFSDVASETISTPTSTTDDYVRVVRRSGLIVDVQLEEALVRYSKIARKRGDDAAALAYHLIESKLLTPWQTKMLLQGRHHGFILGKYKLLDRIGTGGMSSVYLAEHLLMQRQVAIKILPKMAEDKDQSRLERFLAECRAVALLDHPNIVRAFHLDCEYDRYYLVMEYIDGHNMQQKVEREGPLPFRQAADYIRQASEGLAHAHRNNLIHRDIKPANLLVDRAETVKVLDLGLARSTNSNAASLTSDRGGKVLGTADYVAPEQVRDSHDVDVRTDLYGIGGTLYYLLTGQPPFPDGNLAAKLANHLYHQPVDIREVRPDAPLALVRICHKLMAKRREDRMQSALEVSQSLSVWLAGFEGGNLTISPDVIDPPSVGDETQLASTPPAVRPRRQQAEGMTLGDDDLSTSHTAIAARPDLKSNGDTADDDDSSRDSSPSSIDRKKKKRKARPPESDVFTLNEVARYLRLPGAAIRALAQEGRIPCQQIAGHWRFHRKAVDQWLQETNFGSPTWQTLKPQLGVDSWLQPGVLSTVPQVDLEQFCQTLTTHNLLSPDALRRLHGELQAGMWNDTRAAARALVERGELTDYQAAVLTQGRQSGLRFGDYVVLEKLGAGGMAVVYKAQKVTTGQIVALKVVRHRNPATSAEEARRFDREVRAVSKLNHPNIVAAYDAVHGPGESYLVLEFVDGTNLDQWIRRHGRLSVEQAVDYVLQAARGLEHAHSKHLVHRDIKPGNLLLDRQGRIKILDLGLVRFETGQWFNRPQESGAERLTKSETVLGTPDFMAPEQFVDARQADSRADIYALGCTLFFLLSGRSPYQSESPTRVLKAHQTEPIPQLRSVCPDAPHSLQRAFQKMLAKEPSQRFSCMEELITELERKVQTDLRDGHNGSGRDTITDGSLDVTLVEQGRAKSFLSSISSWSSNWSLSRPRDSAATDPTPSRSYSAAEIAALAKQSRQPLWMYGLATGCGAVLGAILGLLSWNMQWVLAVQLIEFTSRMNLQIAPGSLLACFGAIFSGVIGFILVELQSD